LLFSEYDLFVDPFCEAIVNVVRENKASLELKDIKLNLARCGNINQVENQNLILGLFYRENVTANAIAGLINIAYCGMYPIANGDKYGVKLLTLSAIFLVVFRMTCIERLEMTKVEIGTLFTSDVKFKAACVVLPILNRVYFMTFSRNCPHLHSPGCPSMAALTRGPVVTARVIRLSSASFGITPRRTSTLC